MDGNTSSLPARAEKRLPFSYILLDLLHGRALCLTVDAPSQPIYSFDSLDYSIATHEELYVWSEHISLAQVPADILTAVLDRLFFIGTEFPHLTCGSIHALHTLRSSCKEICDVGHAWIGREEIQNFFGTIQKDILIRGPMQLSQSNVYSVRVPRGNTLAYDAAANCVDCLKFLTENHLVGIQFYDETGRNYLHAAIDNDNNDCLQYILNNLAPGDIDRTTAINLSRLCGHPLVQLAEKRNQRGFELVLQQLLGHYNPADLFTDNYFKLKLCAFVSPEFAEQLFVMDLNIGNARDEHGTTSWHAAARGNPHGEDFMIWLSSRSGTEPTIKDNKGHNALMHAAMGNRSTSIQWLCSHVDPMENWVNPATQDVGSGPAYALRLAAESMEENSPDIFRGIMLRIPRNHFENLHNAISIFKLICDTLFTTRQNMAIQHAHPTLEHRMEWENSWRVAAAKCQNLGSFLQKRRGGWQGTTAMRAICDYARGRDLPMLVHGIAPLPPEGKFWFRIFKDREAGGGGRWPWSTST
ncbi:uncharacterized protein N7498_010867 [Penicillium cinerascens]|uniref:Uncharacterized protein n=1 Tax=Penicillium cinerascens TaxID=70096 RepID=A0A9W9J8G8_9EURO|nr:uncharacterized protein N7498_010867 [Penicillium cinerascens]KAJ5191882.1 hypothetical protein N7498_010867 [Penicillium cinerascens]